MKFRNLTSSLLTATAIFTSTLPAFAGPFDIKATGVFKPINTTPSAIGNTKTPTAGTSSNPVGNSEIQGLGDHQSWIAPETLAKDPRALCSDVGLGNNTRSSSSKLALATSTNTRSSSSRSHNDGGGGGGSFLGIVSVNGGGSSQGSQSNSESKDSRYNRTEENSSSSSTVVQGRNCDAFVNSAAARDMNYQDNLTERYRIRTGESGKRVSDLINNK